MVLVDSYVRLLRVFRNTLLLEFNRPSQKLMEHIDAQEARRVEMARRRQVAQEQLEAMNSTLAKWTCV